MWKIPDFLINIVKDIIKDDLGSLSSEMAFNFILTISPFVISLVAIFGLFSSANIIDQIITALSPIVPPDALKLLKEALLGINQASTGGVLTFGFLGTLWAVTGATDVIIKGLNRAYKVQETRPLWITKGLAIFLVFATVIILFVNINLILFTSAVLKLISVYIYIPQYVQMLILLSRWPITFIALFAIILIIYSFMPNINEKPKIRIKSTILGALFFCIFWTIASWLFGIYAQNYGGFNQVYGALGAFIILLTWLYYTAFILLIGGEINAEVYKSTFQG